MHNVLQSLKALHGSLVRSLEAVGNISKFHAGKRTLLSKRIVYFEKWIVECGSKFSPYIGGDPHVTLFHSRNESDDMFAVTLSCEESQPDDFEVNIMETVPVLFECDSDASESSDSDVEESGG